MRETVSRANLSQERRLAVGYGVPVAVGSRFES